MSKKAFDKIAEGLNEALAFALGDAEAFKLHVPAELDVRGIRRAISMSQEDFASAFGFSISQIRDWEQGRTRPLGGNRAYLMLIESNPETVLKLVRQAATAKAA